MHLWNNHNARFADKRIVGQVKLLCRDPLRAVSNDHAAPVDSGKCGWQLAGFHRAVPVKFMIRW